METARLTEQDIDLAASLLKEGKLVAFPTETVYGLGAPLFSSAALASIFSVKGRPSDNPLIVHIARLAQVALVAREIPDVFYRIAEAFFPGPLTVVLQRHPDVPPIVSAGLPTIALRMPAHPLALALIERVGEPLAAPSANLSGRPSPTQCEHVLEDLAGKISAVLDGGKTQYGIESTVISLLDGQPRLLRPGAIPVQEIVRVLGSEVVVATDTRSSPGMRHKHYAPRTPLRLFRESTQLHEYIHSHAARRFLVLSRDVLSREGLPCTADHLFLCAAEFYAHLRYADAQGYDEILIYCDAHIFSDHALMNRISHAAGR